MNEELYKMVNKTVDFKLKKMNDEGIVSQIVATILLLIIVILCAWGALR